MFSKLFIAASVAVLAVATPTPHGDVNQCNTGSLQCCNSIQDANSFAVTHALGLIGASVQDLTGQAALTCNPIDVIGIAGNSCSQQPVCCTGNNFNGAVVLGCTPINANL